MSKIRFGSGYELSIQNGSTIGNILVSTIIDSIEEIINQIISEDLKKIEILNEQEEVIGIYDDCVFYGISYDINSMMLTLKIREKTDAERLQEKIAEMDLQIRVHDGAIGDIAEMVSELAEV